MNLKLKGGKASEILVKISSNILACETIKKLTEYLLKNRIVYQFESSHKFQIRFYLIDSFFEGSERGEIPENMIIFADFGLFSKYDYILKAEVENLRLSKDGASDEEGISGNGVSDFDVGFNLGFNSHLNQTDFSGCFILLEEVDSFFEGEELAKENKSTLDILSVRKGAEDTGSDSEDSFLAGIKLGDLSVSTPCKLLSNLGRNRVFKERDGLEDWLIGLMIDKALDHQKTEDTKESLSLIINTLIATLQSKYKVVDPYDTFQTKASTISQTPMSMMICDNPLKSALASYLIKIPGISQDRALAIVVQYNNLKELMKAYRGCSSDLERESMLEHVSVKSTASNKFHKLGLACSKKVFLAMWCTQPQQKLF